MSSLPTLPPQYFAREDESADELFYAHPRLTAHVDPDALASITALYDRYLRGGRAVLDVMSSCISHLPCEHGFTHVAGLGLNAAELAANDQLTERVVQNVNVCPKLPWAGGTFDAALLALSVQYATRPVDLFAEIGRVLRPGAPLIVTFSHRSFPSKAVAVWRALDDGGHAALVEHYFEDAGPFGDREVIDCRPRRRCGDPVYAVIGRRTTTSDAPR